MPTYHPTITLRPASGRPGTPVQLSGADFPPDATVSVTSRGITLGATTAEPDGSASGSGVVPCVEAGTYVVTASAPPPGPPQQPVTAQASFTVEALAPALVLTPSSAYAGQTVEVRGSDFCPGLSFSVGGWYAGDFRLLRSGTTGADGSFRVTFVVPSTFGDVTVTGVTFAEGGPVQVMETTLTVLAAPTQAAP